MLDTARNYFSVDTIKRTIVGMAHAKLNRFHWHITDSQSFPYMSKAYPQLAKYGAYSSKEIYTVDDIKHITEFARIRGIQVSIVIWFYLCSFIGHFVQSIHMKLFSFLSDHTGNWCASACRKWLGLGTEIWHGWTCPLHKPTTVEFLLWYDF